MVQAANEPSADWLRIKETVVRLELAVDSELYCGEWISGSDQFDAVSDSGKRLLVTVSGNAFDSDAGELPAVQYPHLYGVRRVFREDGRAFICEERPDPQRFETMEKVLAGGGLSLSRRIRIALSLAGAAAELESVYERLPVRQLCMDSILVDKEANLVRMDCKAFLRQCSEAERREQYHRMGRLGLMPPEWYESPETFSVSVQGMRHCLAVWLFRILCASDPFDGPRTIRTYPYKSDRVLPEIYGKSADYILKPGGGNRADRYAGGRAADIFGRICPELKRLFEQAFIEGIADPDARPTAAQWLENQKKMAGWYHGAGPDWRIPDLESGFGTLSSVSYLCLDNGTVLPVLPDKPVLQYMLQEAGEPLEEAQAGILQVQDGTAGFVPVQDGQPEILLKPHGEKFWIGKMGAQVCDRPWKEAGGRK